MTENTETNGWRETREQIRARRRAYRKANKKPKIEQKKDAAQVKMKKNSILWKNVGRDARVGRPTDARLREMRLKWRYGDAPAMA